MLTLLAPAERCNQHCPSCGITTVFREPVQKFELSPSDYVRFVRSFVEEDIPILCVNFQGYEVTLPKSWPYVEAVFDLARDHAIDRGFITNGMLLHKWADRALALDPRRIHVSIDGSTAEVNDPIRGLQGAFKTTTESIRRFLRRAPTLAGRVVVNSIVYNENNFRSLLAMPRVIQSLGLRHWSLSFGLAAVGGAARPLTSRDVLKQWLFRLWEAGTKAGLTCAILDEFGHLGATQPRGEPRVHRVWNPNFLYRLDPLGHVLVGAESGQIWDEYGRARWDPKRESPVATTRYWSNVWELARGSGSTEKRSVADSVPTAAVS